MKHITTTTNYKNKKKLEELFKRADEFSKMPREDYPKPLKHQTVATVFYEPSTRTRLSFETAIQNLGGNTITVENADDSSAKKGETLEDTMRTISCYAQAIVLRHPEVGAAERAAVVSKVPIINGGDGAGEHPTQALLDTYTISRAMGKIEGLKICIVGDLRNSRAMHSLTSLLSVFKPEFHLVTPKVLSLPDEYKKVLEEAGCKVYEHETWEAILPEIDVLYSNRIQQERFEKEEDYLALKDSFILTMKQVEKMKKDSIIMNPLPRINEIVEEVDADPRAWYFKEVQNGLFVRMALLEQLFAN